MPTGEHRPRLSDVQRRLLSELLGTALIEERDPIRRGAIYDLSQRLQEPRPGHPRITQNIKGWSDAYYAAREQAGMSPSKSRELFKLREKIRSRGRCEKCGAGESEPFILEIDHIDANRSNNSMENLQLLCANCHRRKGYESRVKAADILGVDVKFVQSW